MINFIRLKMVILMFLTISSCKNDDDDVATIPPRDLGEVALENDQEIIAYLQTHFYNYEAFEVPPPDFDYQIVLDTIAGENANKTPLIDQVNAKTVLLKGENDTTISHTLYYLVVQQGTGANPTVADSTLVRYKGSLLDGSKFDSAIVPIWFDLLSVVRGFREFMPELKTGQYVGEENGLPAFENYGIGMVIMPSGLGYFAQARANIPLYAPLIFRVALLLYNDADHDQDGILSILEDLDGDGNPLNDDTNANGFPNCYDPDDDGDGTPTINEYDENNDSIPDDTDGDTIPDYLDAN